MKILSIQPGSGHCVDCHRGARFRLEIPHPTLSGRDYSKGRIQRQVLSFLLCPRCAAYAANTLIERIDELRHPK